MKFSATALIGLILSVTLFVALKLSNVVVTPTVGLLIIGGFCGIVVLLAAISKWRYLTLKHRNSIQAVHRQLNLSTAESGTALPSIR